MNEFVDSLSKQHPELAWVLIGLVLIFLIVFALTFVPNEKDAHKRAEKKRQKRRQRDIDFEKNVRDLDRHHGAIAHRRIYPLQPEDDPGWNDLNHP